MTCDSFGGLRWLIVPASRRKAGVSRRAAGACSPREAPTPAARPSSSRGRLLARTGVVFRKTLAREKQPRPVARLARVLRTLEARGEVRGGRFVAGFDGEQYALPEAVTLLRAVRKRESGRAVPGQRLGGRPAELPGHPDARRESRPGDAAAAAGGVAVMARTVALAQTALLLALPLRAAAPPAQMNPLVAGGTELALELHRRVRGERPNVFFSPFSISETFAMAYAGARGETALQMAKTLRFPEADEVPSGFRELERRVAAVQAGGKVELAIANSLWPQTGEPLVPQTLKILKDSGAAPTPVDYRKSPEEARRTINRWVEQKTRDRIKDLLPKDSVTPATRLTVANAVYFKGKWKVPFEKKETHDAPFLAADGKRRPFPSCTGCGKRDTSRWRERRSSSFPYEGDDLSLVVLLPRKE